MDVNLSFLTKNSLGQQSFSFSFLDSERVKPLETHPGVRHPTLGAFSKILHIIQVNPSVVNVMRRQLLPEALQVD
ncbi:hypothetical protein AFLA_004618 [Aspergillus flavus NRRL3357]|nr:hypothetical protein AFLA_004618 [Aspergillus flavus NRRL3357]